MPELRGKGYGKAIFGYAMRHLKRRETIGGERDTAHLATWVFTVTHESIALSGVIDFEALPLYSHFPTGKTEHRVIVEDLRQHRIGRS